MRGGLTILAIMLIGSAVAHAETIGPDCGSCQGATYTLSASWVSGTATQDVWRVTLAINTSGYTGAGVAIGAVAIKVSSSTLGSELVSVPGNLRNWQLMLPGGLSGKGCSGSGSGFDCADWIAAGPGILLSSGSLFTWQFDQTIPKGTLFTGSGGDIASIKVMYTDANGNKIVLYWPGSSVPHDQE